MARGGGHINGDSIYILFRMRKGRSNLARGGGHIHGDSIYILFRMRKGRQQMARGRWPYSWGFHLYFLYNEKGEVAKGKGKRPS